MVIIEPAIGEMGGNIPLIFPFSAFILKLMLSHPENSNWLEIDRGAIANNYLMLRRITSTRVMGVVKANAYGHGIAGVARVIAESDGFYCGVARIDEALELRREGIHTPILILGYTPDECLRQAIENQVTLTIFHPEQAGPLSSAASSAGRKALVHVKVDTGMSRLGATPQTAYELIQRLAREPSVYVEGIFSHYACADELGKPITAQQEKLFLDLLAELQSIGLRPPLAHIANSAAALTRPSSRLDMVRTGIALYGMHPSSEVHLPTGFRPALTWKSRLISVFDLPAGRGVSYGHDYVTQKQEKIGVIPVGYGDGYRRIPGNQVLIHGQCAPIIGRVCMDQMMVRLNEIPEAKVNDEVVLLGMQEGESIQAERLAQAWKTINYEVTSSITARVPRLYHG
jgi:alanine racemase